jgi:subtilisin family serine protease
LRGVDLIDAMNDLVMRLPAKGVVVLSFATPETFATTCNGANAPPADRPVYDAVQTAVNSLYDRGIPVVVATGNSSAYFSGATLGKISAPACLDKVVKVTSMGNMPLSTSVRIENGNMFGDNGNIQNANLPSDAQALPGLTWIAPGAGVLYNGYQKTTVTMPAVTATFAPGDGTSYAAPQIAGLFALYKSATATSTVAEIAAYFNSLSRTYLVQTYDPSGTNTAYRKYRAIRMSAI